MVYASAKFCIMFTILVSPLLFLSTTGHHGQNICSVNSKWEVPFGILKMGTLPLARFPVGVGIIFPVEQVR